MKKLFFLITMAVVLSGCTSSSDDISDSKNPPIVEPEVKGEKVVVENIVDESEIKDVIIEPEDNTPNDILEPKIIPDELEEPKEIVKEVVEDIISADEILYYNVVKVVDGDTVAVDLDGTKETLRLIGIDTPETVDPRKPVQCFGIEASNKAKELLSGKQIRLEADPTQDERDKYDRLLRYIFLEDGTNFQDYMIRNGYAHEYTYNLPYKYQEQFKQVEDEARLNKIGLWADGVCEEEEPEPEQASIPGPTPEPEPIPEPEPAPVVQDNSSYDCSYNKYNCGDFTTHNEAQSVYESCGGKENDIHRLDRDKDGDACESLPYL